MSCAYPSRLLALFIPFFGYANESSPQHLITDEPTVFVGKSLKVIVPECPLALDSLKIVPLSKAENFIEWTNADKLEAYELIQKIIRVWEKKGISDYLIYAKEANHSTFSWEIVPYPKNEWRFWKQFNVLWNITFGGTCLPQVERQRIVKNFQNDRDSFSESHAKEIESIKIAIQENDPFCNPNVIDKQRVFEGKEINVLYNYAPIVLGDEKLHFLMVPKQHRPKFSELTESEYLESMQLSQKLLNYYKNKGYHTAYLFDKSGAEAGQTVPHWHEHLVFTATKTQDFIGKLTVLKNMLFGSSPLPSDELEIRVHSLRKDLEKILAN